MTYEGKPKEPLQVCEAIQEAGRVVGFHPKFALFLGSVNAGILWDQLLYWDKYNEGKRFWITSPQMTEQTGLSYKEQLHARKLLRAKGYIDEQTRRLEHRVYIEVQKAKFNEDFAVWRLKNAESLKGKSTSPQREDVIAPKGRCESLKGQTSKITYKTKEEKMNTSRNVMPESKNRLEEAPKVSEPSAHEAQGGQENHLNGASEASPLGTVKHSEISALRKLDAPPPPGTSAASVALVKALAVASDQYRGTNCSQRWRMASYCRDLRPFYDNSQDLG
jgi:hypothetical protein